MAAAVTEAPPTGLVGPDGEPVESPQLKREQQQQMIRNLFERYAKQQLLRSANYVLQQATRKIFLRLIGARPVLNGPTRLSAHLSLEIRARFLITSLIPPAWVNDRHKPIGKRARREITRQFRERPRHLQHTVASRIIDDIEFAGHVMESWRTAFGEAQRAEEIANALGVDAGRTAERAQATAEAIRTRNVSGRDAPPQSAAPRP